ncbi:MAG: FHIPEP family type III secretion protein [Phycisphaerales bacterium]|nr:FHIPEP family type III secretion protein [Phycisphaerales bacterium]
MAESRNRALYYCCIGVVGLIVRPTFALDFHVLGQQFWGKDIFSTLFDSWRVLLALGILAGLINLIAKQNNREALGIGIPQHLLAHPVSFGLGSAAFILVCLSATSLPTMPLLVVAQLCVLFAWTNYQKTTALTIDDPENAIALQEQESAVRSSIMRIELGKSLLPLAPEESSRNLIDQIASLRAHVYEKKGMKFSSIHIKDNLNLSPNKYRIYLRNGVVAEGIVHTDHFMVVDDGKIELNLEGIKERDPVYGLPVLWITKELRDEVGELFVQVMDPVSVIITHLSHVIDKHAAELLTRDEVFAMVKDLRAVSHRLVESTIGKTITLARLHRIMQMLLEENVSVKDISLILATASDSAGLSEAESVEKIRAALRRQICARVSTTQLGGQQVIRCVELPEDVEVAIATSAISQERVTEALHRAAMPLISEGLPIVVVSSQNTRRKIKEKIACGSDDVIVLCKEEIVPEVELQVVGQVDAHVENAYTAVQSTTEDRRQTVAYAQMLLGETAPSVVVSSGIHMEARLEEGIEEIKSLVGGVLDFEAGGQLSPMLNAVHRSLLQKGIESSLASEIIHHLDVDSGTSKEDMRGILIQELIRRLPRTLPPPSRENTASTVIALVGPTGVGKTTTIAKLATKFRLQQGRTISLITADTYRVAAVDQLQQYANLFDATLEIAGTAEQMKYAIESCKHSDIVLIDTAGRSASDDDRIQETANILKVARPDETHLVLSAATSRSACKRAADSFIMTGYDRVIITKLDELALPGETVSALCTIGKPLSWFTDGQDISAHISQARPEKLVHAIF